MKKLILFIPLFILLILMSGCSEDENTLTSATQEGKGTISFLLNGKVWTPKTKFNFPSTILSHGLRMTPIEYGEDYNKANDYALLEFYALNLKKREDFEFKIDSVLDVGVYKISDAIFKYKKENGYDVYNLVHSASNIITITNIQKDYIPAYSNSNSSDEKWEKGIYSVLSVVSGTFEMTLQNEEGQLLNITKGRFDLKCHGYTDY